MFIYGGGRFSKGSNGRVAYRGGQVKIAEVTNADCTRFTLMDLFHVGNKMDLLNGTPKRAWYVSPGMPRDVRRKSLARRLVPLKTTTDLEEMFYHASMNNKSWMEIYFQDTDCLVRDGDFYMLPGDISNGGDAEFTDAEIDAGVAEKVAAEYSMGLFMRQELQYRRELYRLSVREAHV